MNQEEIITILNLNMLFLLTSFAICRAKFQPSWVELQIDEFPRATSQISCFPFHAIPWHWREEQAAPKLSRRVKKLTVAFAKAKFIFQL